MRARRVREAGRSLARGDFLPHSDVDLLVVACPPELHYRIESLIEEPLEGRPFDPLYLDEVAAARRAGLLAEAVDAADLR